MQKAVVLAAALAGCLAAAGAQNLELPALPYEYHALEPHIDNATMMVHHLGHHQAYLKTVNTALETLRGNPSTKHLAKMGIDRLLQHLEDVPQDVRPLVRNGGGGFVNHILFFNSLSTNGTAINPKSELALAIDKDLGGFESLSRLFKEKATKVFGSGWAWLVFQSKAGAGALTVETTSNQDTPAMEEGKVPLLGIDVWEHAYYLKYQNRRPAYIEGFWQVINWAAVETRFLEARDGPGAKSEL